MAGLCQASHSPACLRPVTILGARTIMPPHEEDGETEACVMCGLAGVPSAISQDLNQTQ